MCLALDNPCRLIKFDGNCQSGLLVRTVCLAMDCAVNAGPGLRSKVQLRRYALQFSSPAGPTCSINVPGSSLGILAATPGKGLCYMRCELSGSLRVFFVLGR